MRLVSVIHEYFSYVSGAKLFVCNICSKKFPTMKNLRRHEKIHQSFRPTCEHCGTTFTQPADLKKHVRKLHTDMYFDCGFCARYYSSSELLESHLAQLHHQDRQGNERELQARGGGDFKVDPLKDRKESMRIASHMKATSLSPVKPGFKFACTVCKKRFHSYANMCRHRRLAHHRHMLQLHYRQKDEEEDDGDVFHKSPFSSPMKAALMNAKAQANNIYFATVAQNIADNLSNHLAGTKDYIEKPSEVIKWMKTDDKAVAAKDDDDAGCAPLEIYNFPSGFKLKKPYELLRPVKLFGKAAKQAKLAQEAMSPAKASTAPLHTPLSILTPPLPTLTRRPDMPCQGSLNGVPPSGAGQSVILSPPNISKNSKECTLPIRVPKVKMCKICRCIFHNHTIFQDHMFKRHKVIVGEEEEVKQEKDEEEQPSEDVKPQVSSPPPKYVEDVTPLDMTVGPLALGLKRASSAPDITPSNGKCENSLVVIKMEADDVKPLDLSGPLDLTRDDVPQALQSLAIGEELLSQPKKVMCDLCFRAFPSRLEVYEHQDKDHGHHIECGFMEVDEEYNPTWKLQPDPLGLLNVSTSQVPLRPGKLVYHCP